VSAYERAGRGRLVMVTNHSLAPDRRWYTPTCPPVPPGPAYLIGPYQTASVPPFAVMTGKAQQFGQIGSNGMPSLLVHGRTRLGVQSAGPICRHGNRLAGPTRMLCGPHPPSPGGCGHRMS